MVLGGHFRNWAELGGKTVQSHLIFYTASWNEYKNLWYQAGDTAIQPALSNGFTQLFHTKMAFLISSDSGWIQKLQSTRKEFLLAADLHHPRAIVSLFTFTIGHWSALWWPMIPPMYFIISFTKQWAGCAASWVCPWCRRVLPRHGCWPSRGWPHQRLSHQFTWERSLMSRQPDNSALNRLVPSLNNYDWQNVVYTYRGFGNGTRSEQRMAQLAAPDILKPQPRANSNKKQSNHLKIITSLTFSKA